ncbi:D-alanyl-D-alanine carboxypeptidase [Clostridium sp. AM58-1XD]|uniref:D-alanyl-D-alanine carboxypeptidase family protein n=1 Tax=Clostridium sp. AM58-1XD TaxID=2292307 RepID=UPI00269C625E
MLSVNDCLYALLLKSANEVANGLAEKVSGSVSAFADKMNARAKELGCKNTHFVNPNGLNSTEHYTTPYDMALIARAAFSNDTLRKIDSTLSHKIPATKKVNQERTVTMGHKMFYSTDSRYYPGIIGGKTGYTSKAGNTLVTGVERDGVRLIAVVMKSKGTHYADTKALLDYGFANRDKLLAAGGQPSVGGPSNPNPSGSEGTNSSAPTAAAQSGSWLVEGENRYYIKEDGTKAAGEWMEIGGEEYWFDANAVMATGWRQFTNGDWYYFGTNGAMVKDQWVQNTGKWFYLGKSGTMLKNTTTPDGYEVGENGARK